MAKINYKLHVVNSLGIYDMILGRDFSSSLGLILDHSTETITWDDADIPMKATSAQVSDSFHIKDPKGINNMVGRIAGDANKMILQAKYKKANLTKEVEDN
eukprot:14387554-Ditylum_brightwellii.AAC.1